MYRRDLQFLHDSLVACIAEALDWAMNLQPGVSVTEAEFEWTGSEVRRWGWRGEAGAQAGTLAPHRSATADEDIRRANITFVARKVTAAVKRELEFAQRLAQGGKE